MATTNTFDPNQSSFPTFKPAVMQAIDSKSTVAGQLDGLIASNSQFLQAARSSAARQANNRGLINSSIAAGAGELAAIQSALPIAQQDAQLNFNANQFNANNQTQINRDENQLTGQSFLQNNQNRFTASEAGLDRGQQLALQSNQQAFQSGENALNRGQELTVLDKNQGLVREQMTNSNNQAALNRGQELTVLDKQQGFAGTQAGLEREQQRFLQNNQQSFQAGENSLNRGQELTVLDRNQGLVREQMSNANQQNALDRQQQRDIQNDQQEFASSQALAERVFQGQQNDAQRELQKTLQNVDANTRVQLATIEADYKQVLQASANASSIFSEFSKNIGAIQTNSSLNADTKTKLVNEQMALMRNAFDIQGKLANLNLAALIPVPMTTQV